MGKSLIEKDQLKSVMQNSNAVIEKLAEIEAEDVEALKDMISEVHNSRTVDVVLNADDWEKVTYCYEQVLAVENITESTNGILSLSQSATPEQYKAAAKATIQITEQEEGFLTFAIYGDVPEVDIPITIIIFG